MCRSSATSLMVRNAFGAFLIRLRPSPASPAGPSSEPSAILTWADEAAGSAVIIRIGDRTAVDPRLQHMTGPEHQHAPRQDRHFLARLRIAADAAPLLSDRKSPEPTDLNGFSRFQR